MATPDLSGITEFAWDSGNALKSQDRHNVSTEEAEQVFFGGPLLLTEDAGHSATESRYWAFGETREARHLMIVFTVRGDRIRVISARDMNRRERQHYENANQAAS